MATWSTRETTLICLAFSSLVACAGDDGVPGPALQSGGAIGTSGGALLQGGASQSGGSNGTSTNAKSTGGSQSNNNGTGGSQSNNDGTGGAKATGGTSSNSSTGGTSNRQTGGNSATGGNRQTGGTNATGGRPATGGNSSQTGGNMSTGGTTATGGWQNPGMGGSATGGWVATGSSATGGWVATGGSATGGWVATGGSATGGWVATGGSATGGSPSSSNSSCSSAVTGGTCPPKSCPQGASDCGCYTFAGLGARKKQILDAGGDVRFIASAMVETENLKTDYKYGDGKSGDAFNAGCCKQNWFMIRQCHPAWRNLTANDYATSAAMNSDLKLDIQVYNECRAAWSDQKWFAAHRNGQQGFDTGYAPNLELFINAYNWTVTNLQNGHMCDDVRFWATVPAIVVD